jgi:hypothetical protein
VNGWDEAGERLITSSREVWEQILGAPPAVEEQTVIRVTKLGAQLPVTTDTLMDEGIIPDTRPARPRRTPTRVTSWTLARSRARTVVAGVRLRLGGWVAGVDLAERDEADEEVW